MKTGCPIIELQGLLGLVEMTKKLGLASACEGEEGRKCPKEQFPPVRKRPLTAPVVTAAAVQQRPPAGKLEQPAGAPSRKVHGDAAEGEGRA